MSRKYVIDIDTTDDFLDYPRLMYEQPDGTLKPLLPKTSSSALAACFQTRL